MDAMNLIPAIPELILTASLPILMLLDLSVPQRHRDITFWLSLLIIAACAAGSAWLAGCCGGRAVTFYGAFIADAVAHVLKLCTYAAMFLTLVYARRYVNERNLTTAYLGGAFYLLALFSLLGQMTVISAGDFLTLYLGIELMTFPLYTLAALKREDGNAVEAATKYFILGALGTGLMLYGISMVYGVTGSFRFAGIASAISGQSTNGLVMVFGVVFIVCGIAFKLGAVPFHMWLPDVFEGVPTAVTLLVAGAPKLAGFAVCLRILGQGLLPMALDWQPMLIVVSILSMALGNLAAIMQKNIKRMLAYSTISHMGYMLIGMLSGVRMTGEGGVSYTAYGASMYYTVVYVLASLGAFGVIMALSQNGKEAEKLDDYKGLHRRNPWMALTMMVCMFSFAGVPPLVGFYGKVAVFQAAIDAGLTWLAVIGILFAVVGGFFYLRVIKFMYLDAPADGSRVIVPKDTGTALLVNGALIVLFGILPGPLMDWCIETVCLSFI